MAEAFGLGHQAKTFRPVKNIPMGNKGATLRRHIQATLGSGNIRDAVALPEGEDLNEWLAVNTVDFYNAISILFGTLEDYCTAKTCPIMNASGKYEYLWKDEQTGQLQQLSAPGYINALFNSVEAQMDDPACFPQQYGVPFPATFRLVVAQIMKRLFRVYAHIYHSHFRAVCALGEEAHLNTCFRHFMWFAKQFQLIEARELAPMQELIDQMLR